MDKGVKFRAAPKGTGDGAGMRRPGEAANGRGRGMHVFLHPPEPTEVEQSLESIRRSRETLRRCQPSHRYRSPGAAEPGEGGGS